MAWGKLDDGYHSHRKIRRAGLAATGVHAMAISYSSAYSLDGFVDVEWIVQVIPDEDERRQILDRLLRLRLFEEVTCGEVRDVVNRDGDLARIGPFEDDGYLVHDFAAYNPTSVEVQAEREARSAAGKKGAATRWGRANSGNGKSHSKSDSSGDAKSNGKHVPRPDPTRPDPENDSHQGKDEEPQTLEVHALASCASCDSLLDDDGTCAVCVAFEVGDPTGAPFT